jgi:hypothetical protein
LDSLKNILVCLYGTTGSIWNRYGNVRVFEEINRLSREVLTIDCQRRRNKKTRYSQIYKRVSN